MYLYAKNVDCPVKKIFERHTKWAERNSVETSTDRRCDNGQRDAQFLVPDL